MTIQGMVDYLTNKGFEVNKTYDRDTNKYTFTIRKNDVQVSGTYEFIPGLSSSSFCARARFFLDRLLNQYEAKYSIDTGFWPKTNPYLPQNTFFVSGSKDRDDGFTAYCITDVESILNPFAIKEVIFNDPATIVIWADGSKTVVKAENEAFDPEKGLAMAIAKKALGNNGNYYETFKKYLPEKKPGVEVSIKLSTRKAEAGIKKLSKAIKKLADK